MRSHRPERLLGCRGVTFVELLIVGVIVLVAVNGMTWALSSSGRTLWIRTDAQMHSLAQAQRALDRISEELRRASRGQTDAARRPVCGANQITFFPAGAGTAIVYGVNGGNLIRTQDNIAQTMAAQITGLTPSCQANGLIRLQLTAQVRVLSTGAASVTQTLNGQVRIPNP